MKKKTLQALHKIHAIIDGVEVPDFEGLITGKSGLVLYYFYLGKVLNNYDYHQKANELLASIFEKVQSNTSSLISYSLASGASGFCIMMDILYQEGFLDMDIESNLEPFNEYIFEKSLIDIKNKQVDFLHQGVGGIYYFSIIKQTTKTKEYLEQLVDAIYELGITDESSFKFLNSFGPDSGTKFDLSLSHGLSGILLVLIKVYNLGIRQEKTKVMIQRGIDYTLSFYRGSDSNKNSNDSFFPIFINEKDSSPVYSTMLAWCYGDLNQLYLLIEASKMFGTNEWEKIIDQVGEGVCKRSLEDSLIDNSHFCHGAAGICHMFRQLNFKSPKEIYRKAHKKWIDYTLDLLDRDIKSGLYNGRETELLEGMAGVGMVLLSSMSNEKLKWNKTFLI